MEKRFLSQVASFSLSVWDEENRFRSFLPAPGRALTYHFSSPVNRREMESRTGSLAVLGLGSKINAGRKVPHSRQSYCGRPLNLAETRDAKNFLYFMFLSAPQSIL